MTARRQWLFGSGAVILIAIAVTFIVRLNQPTDSIGEPSRPDVVETEALTEEPAATADVNVPFQDTLSANDFSISITRLELYSRDADLRSLGDPPRGTQWALVTASLINESSSTLLTIERDDLVLITHTGETLLPLADVDGISPYLIDQTLHPDESIYGFAVYAIPPTLEAVAVGWCPIATCTEMLTAPIPTILNR